MLTPPCHRSRAVHIPIQHHVTASKIQGITLLWRDETKVTQLKQIPPNMPSQHTAPDISPVILHCEAPLMCKGCCPTGKQKHPPLNRSGNAQLRQHQQLENLRLDLLQAERARALLDWVKSNRRRTNTRADGLQELNTNTHQRRSPVTTCITLENKIEHSKSIPQIMTEIHPNFKKRKRKS